MEKKCTVCGEVKDVSEFRVRGKYKSGGTRYQSACKPCSNLQNLANYHRYKDNGERAKVSYRYTLLVAYGLSEQDYIDLYDKQGGLCEICGAVLRNPFTGTVGKKTSVDHDHTTGAVRGLLCGTCNTGMGGLKDSVLLLRSAIKYLEKHGGSS